MSDNIKKILYKYLKPNDKELKPNDKELKPHIVLIVGTRPNFIKAFPVYESLKTIFRLTLIHTGQHFDSNMSDIFFKQLMFPVPDILLDDSNSKNNSNSKNDSSKKYKKAGMLDMMLYTGRCDFENLNKKKAIVNKLITYKGDIGQLGDIRDKLNIKLSTLQPDLVMVFGDVTSTLAGALSAKSLNIDIAHVESGLRSGDITMPEEVNRILVDYMSTYLFVTEKSGIENLHYESITKNIFLVGNTMFDTQRKFLPLARNTNYNKTIGVSKGSYVLLTLHRPSNVDCYDRFMEIYNDIIKLSKSIKVVYPVHHRTREQIKNLGGFDDNVILLEPLGYLEFTCLMINSKYVITDSGGIQEETSNLRIKCLTLRSNTERPSTLVQNGGTNQLIERISHDSILNLI